LTTIHVTTQTLLNVIKRDETIHSGGWHVTTDLSTALFQFTTALFAAALAWAALVALLASWTPTARLARALTPRVIRAAVFTTVSGTLAFSPAHAAGDLDGLPLPIRAAGANASPADHIVQPGDSLWTIAASTLPPDTPLTGIARASTDWFIANRGVIGDDPDLIHPGQSLSAPVAEEAR
jgi:nucleoid-associated protein YgaU